MAFLDWDDRMAVGIDEIDEQHRELVNLINHVAGLAEAGPGDSELAAALKRFHDYTMSHFSQEQRLMDHRTYPEYFRHLDEHLECANEALSFYRDFIQKKPARLDEFLEYMVSWFRGHTMGTDQTLGAYLKAKGVK